MKKVITKISYSDFCLYLDKFKTSFVYIFFVDFGLSVPNCSKYYKYQSYFIPHSRKKYILSHKRLLKKTTFISYQNYIILEKSFISQKKGI